MFFITSLRQDDKPIATAFAKNMDFDGDEVHTARSIHIRDDIGAYLNGLDNATIYVRNKKEFDNLSRNVDNLDRVQEKIELIDNSISQPEPIVNTFEKENITKHDIDETRYSIATKKKVMAKLKENKAREERRAEKRAQEAQKATEGTEAQKSEKTSAEAKSGAETAEKSSDRTNESSEPKISEAKEALTDEQRKEKARERAAQMIEYEKENAPTAKELNTAREYVKNFDNLSQRRKASIIRTIRSANGKVDAKTLKGVANLIAAMRTDDVEIRFAEGIGNHGLHDPNVAGRGLIIIDSSTKYKDTIRGTIAHELLHHLEKKASYKPFAEYVMKRVKPEKRKETEEAYTNAYRTIYMTEALNSGMNEAEAEKYAETKISSEQFKALLESEVVAKYVGNALDNETFLKKYADKDRKLISIAAEWLVNKAKSLKKNKNVDREAVAIAEDMAFRLSVLVQSERVIADGNNETRYAESGKKVKAFSEIAVSTALYDALDHKDSGDDNLILMSKMPRFIEDTLGITGDFYVYRDHLYENTVSKERAIEEGRPTKRGKKDIHFHDLGEERMIEAIMSIESPIISVEVHSKDNNPTVIMALPVLDDNGSPLRAVLSFYSNQSINGSFEQKPHIVLTITPCQMTESSGARKGWAEFISEAVEDGRVLSYDKEKGSVLSVIAQQARLGNITEASLNDSISRFKRFVNDFKQENKISKV